MNATQTTVKIMKELAAEDREAYFKSPGATAAGWRGITTVNKDKKKDTARKACRNKGRSFQD